MQQEYPILVQLLDHRFNVRGHASSPQYSYREAAAAAEGEASYRVIYVIRTRAQHNPTPTTLMDAMSLL